MIRLHQSRALQNLDVSVNEDSPIPPLEVTERALNLSVIILFGPPSVMLLKPTKD